MNFHLVLMVLFSIVGTFFFTLYQLAAGNAPWPFCSAILAVRLRNMQKEAMMKKLETDLLLFASDLAVRDSLRTEHEIRDYFPETRNHEGPVNRVIAAADALGLPVLEMPDLWRASEDFGYYLKECPGAIFYIGSGENYPPLHTGAFDFNDSLLEPVVDIFRKLAV